SLEIKFVSRSSNAVIYTSNLSKFKFYKRDTKLILCNLLCFPFKINEIKIHILLLLEHANSNIRHVPPNKSGNKTSSKLSERNNKQETQFLRFVRVKKIKIKLSINFPLNKYRENSKHHYRKILIKRRKHLKMSLFLIIKILTKIRRNHEYLEIILYLNLKKYFVYHVTQSFEIKFVSRSSNAVIYTSNPSRPFKAPSRAHISYTSTIIIDSSSILCTHSELKYHKIVCVYLSFPPNSYKKNSKHHYWKNLCNLCNKDVFTSLKQIIFFTIHWKIYPRLTNHLRSDSFFIINTSCLTIHISLKLHHNIEPYKYKNEQWRKTVSRFWMKMATASYVGKRNSTFNFVGICSVYVEVTAILKIVSGILKYQNKHKSYYPHKFTNNTEKLRKYCRHCKSNIKCKNQINNFKSKEIKKTTLKTVKTKNTEWSKNRNDIRFSNGKRKSTNKLSM
ncbi:hypothetical protein AGLY_002886, partial [Aphis glycines]